MTSFPSASVLYPIHHDAAPDGVADPLPPNEHPPPGIPPLLQLIQMFQPRQHDLLARLLNLPRQKNLVQDRVHLVEIKDQVQLAHVAEEGVEHLDEEVDRLEERELVVVGVDARAKEEPGVPPVDHLVVAELDEVGLVFLVPRGDEAVDLRREGRGGLAGDGMGRGDGGTGGGGRGDRYLAFELDLFVVRVGDVPLC